MERRNIGIREKSLFKRTLNQQNKSKHTPKSFYIVVITHNMVVLTVYSPIIWREMTAEKINSIKKW